MTQNCIGTRLLYGAGLFLGLVMAAPVWSLDSTQSTGTGVIQGEDGSMSTKQGETPALRRAVMSTADQPRGR